jgi:hypothetical protein
MCRQRCYCFLPRFLRATTRVLPDQTLRIQLLKILAVSVGFLVSLAKGAEGQLPPQERPYPMNDIAVTLSSGTVVRIRNFVVFRTQTASSLTIYIETPTPSTEPARLASEAQEIAGLEMKSPSRDRPTTVRVGVCRTQGCLEMREIPLEMFLFTRRPDGSLQSEKRTGPV